MFTRLPITPLLIKATASISSRKQDFLHCLRHNVRCSHQTITNKSSFWHQAINLDETQTHHSMKKRIKMLYMSIQQEHWLSRKNSNILNFFFVKPQKWFLVISTLKCLFISKDSFFSSNELLSMRFLPPLWNTYKYPRHSYAFEVSHVLNHCGQSKPCLFL